MLVTPGFPPSRGGVEEHVGQLAHELAALGHPVHVLTARRGLREVTTEEVLPGLQVSTYPAWPVSAMSVAPRLLLAALRLRGSQVLHVHSYHASSAFALLNPAYRGRTVFTPHYHGGGHSALARWLHRAYKRFAPVLFRASQAVICVSDAERELLLTAVPAVASRVTVIPNGVALDLVRVAKPFSRQPPTVLSLGRLHRYKGVAQLLRGFVEVPAPTQLVVIGEGPDRTVLEAEARQLGLQDRVHWLGSLPTSDVHRWLRTAHVLVSLSQREAFGMAPLEAAAGGARVVLSTIPAHREIVSRYLAEVAVLVKDDEPGTVAQAISGQLRRPRPEQVAVPSWREVARLTVELYDRLGADLSAAGTRTHGLSENGGQA